jgi:hypothetical protein
VVGLATIVDNLLDVPATVSLASYKGFDPTVRFSIKLLHLASFEAPGSQKCQDLSYFQLPTETVFAFL